MSGLSASEIDHLAKLARLSLSEAEKERFSQELPKIAEFVETLQKSEITAKPEPRVLPLDQLRDDEVGSNGLSLEQLSMLAPKWDSNQNVVPPVFGGGDDA